MGLNWIARNSHTIRTTGAFYVPPDIVNLKNIVDSKGCVKFIIGGKEYMFKRAQEKRNRVSGMGEVKHLFKGIDEFKCEFDSKRKLIMMKIPRGRKSISRIKRQRLSKKQKTKKPDEKEKYFLRKMGLKKHEYEYRGDKYDFKIVGKKAKKLGKYIEVKGIDNKYHTINLTKIEYTFAKNHKPHYVIYLIENWGSKKIVYKIPFGKLDHRPDAHTFRFRKKEMNSFEIV